MAAVDVHDRVSGGRGAVRDAIGSAKMRRGRVKARARSERLLGVGLIVQRRESLGAGRRWHIRAPPSRQPHHLHQHRFAGIDQFFQRDARRRPCGAMRRRAASSGTWTNAARRGPLVRCRSPRSRASSDNCRDSCRHRARRAHRCRCRRAARSSLAVCGPNVMASAPPAIDPLRDAGWSASGHSMVTALRARVSIRTCAVRAARPNISSACGRCFASTSGNSRSTAL